MYIGACPPPLKTNPRRCRQDLFEAQEGARGLISVEDCVMLEQTSLGFFISGMEEVLLQGVKDDIMSENENPITVKDRLRKSIGFKSLRS